MPSVQSIVSIGSQQSTLGTVCGGSECYLSAFVFFEEAFAEHLNLYVKFIQAVVLPIAVPNSQALDQHVYQRKTLALVDILTHCIA